MACRFDAGEKPDFLSETKNVREGSWKVTAINLIVHSTIIGIPYLVISKTMFCQKDCSLLI